MTQVSEILCFIFKTLGAFIASTFPSWILFKNNIGGIGNLFSNGLQAYNDVYLRYSR